MSRGEYWIGAAIAALFCLFAAGATSIAIAAILTLPVTLVTAAQSSSLESYSHRFGAALPACFALTLVLIGLIGLLGGR